MTETRPKAFVSWSSGKDSAFALYEARRLGLADIVGVLTTVTETYGRVAMHGVRETVLDRQVAALGLPVLKVFLPSPCSNADYEARMEAATAELVGQGVRHVVFGDLFLEDIRAYRERQMARAGMVPIFPLWGRDTAALAEEMIANGLEARLVSVDPTKIDKHFAGRLFDRSLLADLPAGADPCGENGEFHTVVTAGPMFGQGIRTRPGEIVERDGFVFADVIAED